MCRATNIRITITDIMGSPRMEVQPLIPGLR
jgi:hypothetical protein